MTKNQRALIWFGIFIILVMCLFPPWSSRTKGVGSEFIGFHPIYERPSHWVKRGDMPDEEEVWKLPEELLGKLTNEEFEFFLSKSTAEHMRLQEKIWVKDQFSFINTTQLMVQVIIVIIITVGAVIALSKKNN